MDQFLEKHKPQQLSQFETGNMNSYINSKETALIILKQEIFRPKAFTSKFYQIFKEISTPIICNLFQNIGVHRRSPETELRGVCVCVCVCRWGEIYLKELDDKIEKDSKSKICRICWQSGDPGRVNVAVKIQRQSTSKILHPLQIVNILPLRPLTS